jgi:putative NADH-flavin reductase
MPLLLRNVLTDHAKEEDLIKQSTLDWVIVRPARLTNGPYTGRYQSGEDVRGGTFLASISRADVADFMVKQLTDDRYVHGTPAVLY